VRLRASGIHDLASHRSVKRGLSLFSCLKSFASHATIDMNGANVRMIQRGSSARFQPESLECLWITGKLIRQKLECHSPAEFDVLRAINYSHSSSTEPFENSITRYRFPNHQFILSGNRKKESKDIYTGTLYTLNGLLPPAKVSDIYCLLLFCKAHSPNGTLIGKFIYLVAQEVACRN
jgi:hypothetical protein